MKQKIFSISMMLLLAVSIYGQDSKTSFYQFSAKSLQGNEIKMNDYKGKVVLVVNTASKCGFTPQYKDLEALYKKYSSKGLVILGFPCNQFANQEPGSAEEIAKFCTLNYDVTFPMFSKIDVNGDNADPIYKYLKKSLAGTITDDIKWNFTKFLLDRNGKPIKRFASTVNPKDITPEIEKLLAEK